MSALDERATLLQAYQAVQRVVERIDQGAPPEVVELDQWPRADGTKAHLRGVPLLEILSQNIELNEEIGVSSTQLLAGFKGTGKTTLLLQLEQRLRARNFIVLGVDVAEHHDLAGSLSFESLLVSLAAAIGERGRDEIGSNVVGASSAFLKRVNDILGANLDLGAPLDLRLLRVQLKSGAPFSDRLRTRLSEKQGEVVQAFRSFFADFVAALGNVRPVLLVDGLEKMTLPTDQTAAAYRNLTEVFLSHSRELAIEHTHVVYVLPPQCLVIAPHLDQSFSVQLIPCVRIESRPPRREPDADGHAALRAVLAERLDVSTILGPGALDAIITASGGHLRTLLRLAGEVIKAALARRDAGVSVVPIAADVAAEAIREFSTFRRNAARAMTATLAEVARQGDTAGLDTVHVDRMAIGLDNEHILAYRNGDIWYDVHPLVRPVLEASHTP